MLLIDALYINVGGGKVLLDYLIQELEKAETPIFYLLDERIRGKHPAIKERNKVEYLVAGMSARKQFYRRYEDGISTVLCFANIPPSIKGNFRSYTYFHNLILLEIPNEFPFMARLKFRLKIQVIKSLKKNTDFWWVQTNYVQKTLSKKFGVAVENVKLFPFYPPFMSKSTEVERIKGNFLFVSNATPNKNHERLLEAFCSFFDEHKTGQLTLTVNSDYPLILDLIAQKINEGYPINNVGFVEREHLVNLYQEAEYLIYPSVNESFGLGLVEAIENGCKILGADLPYTDDVCIPSLIFDPYKVDAIKQAFEKAITKDLPQSTSKIENQIDNIIQTLTQREA